MKGANVLILAMCMVAFGVKGKDEAPGLLHFRGVITAQLRSEKVLRITEIITPVQDGVSYVGYDSILVKVDKNIELRSGWTVVDVTYRPYDEPKIITPGFTADRRRKLHSKAPGLVVRFHAESIDVVGSLDSEVSGRRNTIKRNQRLY